MAKPPASAVHLGLPSGIALVVANMVGAGVFVSAGYMSQEMGPGMILLAWVIGAVIAMAGARAYAQVAVWIPRSGGEYRFLSDLLHPALGYLAGWGSLLVGFSAPIAAGTLAAGAFAATIVPGLDPRTVAVTMVLVFAAFHATRLQASKWTHNGLVVVDAVLLLGFVAAGLALGQNRWPEWTPPNPPAGSVLPTFARSLFYVAFAFSGWNAPIYVASAFRDPRRDVPRAMLIGCGLVAAFYLIVNWVFVANLTPQQGRVVFDASTPVTLGHVVIRRLLGDAAGGAMSLLAMVALAAGASAMTLVGPRVYAAMAEDGFLPRQLRARSGFPPTAAVWLQSTIAVLLIFTHSMQQVLSNMGAILTLFAALVSLAVLRERLMPTRQPRPDALTVACASVYVASSGAMLYFGLRGETRLLLWVAVVVAAGLAAYALTRSSASNRERRASAVR